MATFEQKVVSDADDDALQPALPTAMVQMLGGFQTSQALYVAAVLGVPDQLVARSRSVTEIATAVGALPEPLGRLLRTLASIGIFEQIDEHTFGLTQLGETLTSSSAGSVRDLAISWMETHYAPFGRLLDTVRTGQPAAEAFYGEPFFTWLQRHPGQVDRFTQAMSGVTHGLRAGAIACIALDGMQTVVDVGGADGMVLLLALADRPDTSGIVFDLPHVIAAADANVSRHGMTNQVTTVGGDFFDSVPGGDGYLLSHILHDWDDHECGRILANIQSAAQPGARLRVLEFVVPSGPEPHLAKMIDLTMLGMLTGRERSRSQWKALLETNGFRLDRIVATPTPLSVLEATAR